MFLGLFPDKKSAISSAILWQVLSGMSREMPAAWGVRIKFSIESSLLFGAKGSSL